MCGDAQADPRLLETARLAAVGELAAGAAHEINNPLFAILGLVELMLADAEPGTKLHERLELVHETGLEIKTIVRALLDLARPGSGERGLLRLDDSARESAELFRRLSADKSVELVERYDPGETTVEGSRAALLQLFVHLLTAVSGGSTITIAVEPAEGGVVAEVRHDGPQQPDADDLGIAASRAIAALHGGTLAVERGPEEKTVFRLWLPRADRDTDEQTTLPGGG
jgi:two-component system NtrC family sensor kinase